MNLHKITSALCAIALIALPTFVACDDDNTTPIPLIAEQAIVVNQSIQGDNSASWGHFALLPNDSTVYTVAPDGSLGDTPQNPVHAGRSVYVGDNMKNLVNVYHDLSLMRTDSIVIPSPQGITAYNNYVFVIGGDSVYAINARNNKKERQLYVGPRIYNLVVQNNSLYITQGMDWNSIATVEDVVFKVNIPQFLAGNNPSPQSIPVGKNPYNNIVADTKGNVFLVCSGNFSTRLPDVWKIDASDKASKLTDGSFIAIRNNTLYVVELPSTVKTLNTTTGAVINSDFLATATTKPTRISFIAVSPITGSVFFGSNENGYNQPGFLFQYSAQGALVKKYASGKNPYAMVFY